MLRKELTDFDRRAIYYMAFRHQGLRAIEAHKRAKEIFNELERLVIKDDNVSNHLIRDLLPFALVLGMFMFQLKSLKGG